jgi:ferritin-like protein
MQLAAKQVSECVRAFPVLNRLLELGGKPTTDLMGSSTCGFPPPDDPHDLNSIIELVLKGERCAIEKYNNLIKNII